MSRSIIEYLRLGCPTPFPSVIIRVVSTHAAPDVRYVLNFPIEVHYAYHKTDNCTILLVRKKAPPPAVRSGIYGGLSVRLLGDDSTHIYVPLIMRT